MIGVETLVFGGVCLMYLHFMIRDCIQGRQNRMHTQDLGWGIVDHDVIFIPASDPVFRKIEIETLAPLDSSEPKENECCPICLEDLKDMKYRRKTKCGHIFCSECLREWLHKKQVCPLCNVDL